MVAAQRGSIVWVRLGEGVGAEQNKRRPAIVVSHNAANKAAQSLGHGVITVVPVTSQARPPALFQTIVPKAVTGLSHDALVQTEQIRAVDIRRVQPTAHVLSQQAMAELDTALKIHLGLH